MDRGADVVMRSAAKIARAGRVDGAVVDLGLQGGPAFAVAGEPARRGIPLVFLTSRDATPIPERFAHVARRETPSDTNGVVPLLLT